MEEERRAARTPEPDDRDLVREEHRREHDEHRRRDRARPLETGRGEEKRHDGHERNQLVALSSPKAMQPIPGREVGVVRRVHATSLAARWASAARIERESSERILVEEALHVGQPARVVPVDGRELEEPVLGPAR